LENAYFGLLNNLDPHSFYISKGEMANVEEEMQGSFEGIGIEFNILEDTLFVVAPIAGGPSEKAGIFSGDRIIKVGDKNIAGVGLSNIEVMRLLKGEKGTKVKIYVKRSGYNELLPFTLTRDEIPLYSIDYSYLITPITGYIKINRFSETTYKELAEAYKKWNILRELITFQNITSPDTKEPLCAICLADPITHTVVPCGHTFCTSCVRRINVSCYLCRGPVRERIKLFFT
jgi:C-terminal peptidase prc